MDREVIGVLNEILNKLNKIEANTSNILSEVGTINVNTYDISQINNSLDEVKAILNETVN